MCVVCALCVSVLWHSRTSALSHLADTALPTPARSHTGSLLPTAPCVPRCTTSAFSVVPHCLALGTTLHCVCPAAPLLWAGGSGQCNALPGGCGQWKWCFALPHCLRAVGSGTPAAQCLPPLGQWAGHLLQYTAALPGAVGSGTPATHCATAWGQWAVDLLQRTASLPGGSGQ